MALDLLGVLAEPNRRRLLALLGSGERSVTDLAAEFSVTRPAISQHLAALMHAGLVEVRQDGRFRYYRVVPQGIAALHAEIDAFWTAELDDLARAGRPTERTDAVYDKSVFIPVPPEEAFALVTQPDRLRRWQTVAARIDLRAGGEFRWTVTPGHIAAGTVTEVDPGKRLVLAWGWETGDGGLAPGDSTVTITVTPGDGGSFVRLLHEGLNAEQTAGHAEGWNHFLDRLVAQATDGDAGPDEWAAAPDPVDALNAAEATLAICLRAFRDLDAEDLEAQTPCEDFTVAQLGEHLLGSIAGLTALAGGTPVAPEGDLEDRIATAAEVALEAWRARGLEGTIPAGPADAPAEMLAGILSIEFLVHGWDAAQAVGRTVVVADPVADYVAAGVEAIASGIGRDERFGPAIEAAPDADAMARLIALTGRVPLAATVA